MEGIVLKRISYLESSLILTVITKDDYYSLIVKGAKKKNSNKLSISEPLSLIDFNFLGTKSLKTLVDGEVLNHFTKIKNDLDRLTISNILLEYSLLAKELNAKIENIYYLLKNSLQDLETQENPEDVLFNFELILLSYIGIPIKSDYIKERYENGGEIINELKKQMNLEENLNRSLLRKFYKDYYLFEAGISLKSKKIYEQIII